MNLTSKRLRQVLEYDKKTGAFRWKVATNRRIRLGDVAGCIAKKRGYRRIRVDGRLYLASRLAWLYVRGCWPESKVDHKNGIVHDDRWENLRQGTQSFNLQNQRRAHRDSKTGMLGVSPSGKNFQATIKVDGARRHLGMFTTAKAAHAAYLEAKRKLHPGGTL